ncbi:MAG: hypothetical protein OXB88_10305 [Bacteriovoracales bacterium]|nr:hypothetical protein [Bacteriovoracales bacterium]
MEAPFKTFLDWASRRLAHLDSQKRLEILEEMASYLRESSLRQNLSSEEILRSLGNKVQFLNGFLIKRGERPLFPTRRPLRAFIYTLFSLLALSILLVSTAFYLLGPLFDFENSIPLDGSMGKMMGGKKGIDLMFTGGQMGSSFEKKYVRRYSRPRPGTRFDISLGRTLTTVSFHEDPHYSVSCEIDREDDIAIDTQKARVFIRSSGESNCDIALPEKAFFKIDFKGGRLGLDRPLSSFRVVGKKGRVVWIKNQGAKYQIFYDVGEGKVRGEWDDIFRADAPQKADIKLQEGLLSFISP